MTSGSRLVRSDVSDPSVLVELRRATAPVHSALETRSDIEARLIDPGARAEMVGAFYAFHDAAERGLEPFSADMAACGWRATPRAVAIGSQARRLGAQIRRQAHPGRVDSLGEALGWTYVVEGSTLGGRIIRRRLAAAGTTLTGLDFLDPWGDATGARWRNLVQVLEDAARTGRADLPSMLRGAQAAFELASHVLVPYRHSEPAL